MSNAEEKRQHIQEFIDLFFEQEEETKEYMEMLREFNRLMAYYRCAILEIETKFNVLNEEFSLRYDRNPINGIKSRLKGIESIKNKLENKKLPFSMKSIEENLHDVAGIRVICSFTEDVYMLAQALLKQDDIELIEVKDYIKNPKPNGYRSLHLIVTVPIFFTQGKAHNADGNSA